MRICINWLLLTALLLASITYAEETTKGPTDKSSDTATIPSFFQEVTSPLTLSVDSIFYNQKMEKKSLENFDNHFIIVHFWASWCMDCQSELIALNRLQKDFRKKALMVIVLSEDFKGISTIDDFFTKHKIDYLDIYVDKKSDIYNKLKINHLPTSYLVDFNGNVIANSQPGIPVDWDDETLRSFLETKVSYHQLLPPEFKTIREKYVPSESILEKPITQKSKEKSKIFIN